MMISKKNIIRVSLFVLAFTFITVGTFLGEVNSVYKKGSVVCIECIGIG
jgi:hypothetical protein